MAIPTSDARAATEPAEGSNVPPLRRPRLLDRFRDAARVRHLARSTERVYSHWVRRYILHHGKRHPLEMGEAGRGRLARRRLPTPPATEELPPRTGGAIYCKRRLLSTR